MAVAFENPTSVTNGLLGAGALTGVVGGSLVLGMLDGLRAARAAEADDRALAAWDRALGTARHNAQQMAALAKSAVVAALDAQDEADALRLEIAQLRRGIAVRDNAIRALSN